MSCSDLNFTCKFIKLIYIFLLSVTIIFEYSFCYKSNWWNNSKMLKVPKFMKVIFFFFFLVPMFWIHYKFFNSMIIKYFILKKKLKCFINNFDMFWPIAFLFIASYHIFGLVNEKINRNSRKKKGTISVIWIVDLGPIWNHH